MTTVAKLVRRRERIKREKIEHDWPLPETLMGIELEVERRGSTIPNYPPPEWTSHGDGSLTDGVEFVLARPLAGAELRGAINSLFREGQYARSMTGSTHIHMDMLEETNTTNVLQVLVMLVYCLEGLLYAVGDPSREWCGFANRLQSGPDNLISVVMRSSLHELTDQMVQEFRQNYSRDTSRHGRYYGLNLASLIDYGSLEFRYFPTATSEEEMVEWVELVQQFKKAAMALGSVEALDEMLSTEDNYLTFMHQWFGKYSNLFSYVGNYRAVRSMYQKAKITASLESAPGTYIFNGSKVFADGRYSKFVENVPEVVAGDVLFIPRDRANVVPAESVNPWTVMVYNDGVYVAQPRNYGQRWALIHELPYAVIRSAPDLMNNLATLVSDPNYQEQAGFVYQRHIQAALVVGSVSPPDYPSFAEPEPDDFDDDDYDYEDEE